MSTPCPLYKYIDDSTVFEICRLGSVSRIQESANIVDQWTRDNDMRINTSKTYELLIDFRNSSNLAIPHITLDGSLIKRTESVKILGVSVSANLTWNVHVDYIISKASRRVYMLYQLTRAGINQSDLLRIYTSVIRPVLEYMHAHTEKNAGLET